MISLLLTILFSFVELNCENFFDYSHDEGKNDMEYLPHSARKWDKAKYWHKVNHIAQEIISCGGEGVEWSLPDMVALTEVENDSVMSSLTQHGPLRNAGYKYIMTQSNDERGIDVALIYSPFSFQLIGNRSLQVNPPKGQHATRDILHAWGRTLSGDTLHVFVVHAPSRVNGVKATRPYRIRVAERICQAIDSICDTGTKGHIIVAGDFNDHAGDKALDIYQAKGLVHISKQAKGHNGARGTYKHMGRWGSLDHIFASETLASKMQSCEIHDAPFLLEEDEKYGGVKPMRTYNGYLYNKGYSDHLPLLARFLLQ